LGFFTLGDHTGLIVQRQQKSESSDECHRKDNDNSATEKQIFEKIHKDLVCDTIEQNLSNLIDVQPEGVR
jgi:hypothetical protein